MSKLKLINQEALKDWAQEIFQKNSFNMIDVSSKKETFTTSGIVLVVISIAAVILMLLDQFFAFIVRIILG